MMVFLVTLSVVVLPFIMLAVYQLLGRWVVILDVVAVIAVILFEVTSAVAVYLIRRDGTIFMTNIHRLFDNYIFLISAAYLGIYGAMQLIRYMFRHYK